MQLRDLATPSYQLIVGGKIYQCMPPTINNISRLDFYLFNLYQLEDGRSGIGKMVDELTRLNYQVYYEVAYCILEDKTDFKDNKDFIAKAKADGVEAAEQLFLLVNNWITPKTKAQPDTRLKKKPIMLWIIGVTLLISWIAMIVWHNAINIAG